MSTRCSGTEICSIVFGGEYCLLHNDPGLKYTELMGNRLNCIQWFYGCYASCYGFKPLKKIFGGEAIMLIKMIVHHPIRGGSRGSLGAEAPPSRQVYIQNI